MNRATAHQRCQIERKSRRRVTRCQLSWPGPVRCWLAPYPLNATREVSNGSESHSRCDAIYALCLRYDGVCFRGAPCAWCRCVYDMVYGVMCGVFCDREQCMYIVVTERRRELCTWCDIHGVCVCVCVDCVNVYVMFMPLRQSQPSPELDILCVNGKCAAHIVSTECVNLNDPPNGPLLHAELHFGLSGTHNGAPAVEP